MRAQASLCVPVHSKPGMGRRRLVPPALRIILSAWSRSPLSVSTVCESTKCAVPDFS